MKKHLKDIILIGTVLVIAISMFFFMRPSKQEGSNAMVYYQNHIYATIDFNKQKVVISEEFKTKEYPKIVTTENHTTELIVVGDYRINNKETFMYIEIDFENKRVRVRKDDSPYQIAVKRGWYDGSGLPLISAPNSISIIFEMSEVDGSI